MRWSKVVPSGVVWEKYLRWAMSALCALAAAVRWTSTASGAQSLSVRSLLTRVTTWSASAAGGGVEVAGGGLGGVWAGLGAGGLELLGVVVVGAGLGGALRLGGAA